MLLACQENRSFDTCYPKTFDFTQGPNYHPTLPTV